MSSTSIDFHTKVTVHEVHLWVKTIMNEHGHEYDDEQSFTDMFLKHKPEGYKPPRKARKSKTTSNTSERALEEYDDSKCDARIWLSGGYDAQCSSKVERIPGKACLCKRHQAKADKHDGKLENGYFNMARPTHHYDLVDIEKERIPWHDVVIEKPSKKTRSTKPRKCSLCGCEGHTKRKCPQKEGEVNTQVIPEERVNAEIGAGTGVFPDPDQVEAEAPEEVPVETPEETPTETPDENPTETPTEPTEPDLVLDSDETEIMEDPMISFTFGGIPYERNQDGEVFDDDFNQVGEWVDGKIKFTYEGVPYLRNEDGEVIDVDEADDSGCEPVGTWDGEGVEFTKLGGKAHKFAKSQLQN